MLTDVDDDYNDDGDDENDDEDDDYNDDNDDHNEESTLEDSSRAKQWSTLEDLWPPPKLIHIRGCMGANKLQI